MSLKPVPNIILGCDPELFLERDGRIIGSERVIPEAGLKPGNSIKATVVRDGIQVELNPTASANMTMVGRSISTAFEMLAREVRKHEGVSISFRDLVDVERAELDALSETSRVLGCKPSKNIYGVRPITVDPKTYTKRSAGGHAHFGLSLFSRSLFEERDNMVSPFDIFVGNTCTMIDRGPGAKERRENYGRAGEYRTPTYGVEYRTLSNFWLRNYSLMTLVYGLSSIAISMINEGLQANPVEDELIEMVNIKNFVTAIDTNDAELARKNFDSIRPFLVKHLPKSGFPLNEGNIDKFLTFTEGVQANGLESFFPQDPVEHWISLGVPGAKFVDFSTFLETIY